MPEPAILSPGERAKKMIIRDGTARSAALVVALFVGLVARLAATPAAGAGEGAAAAGVIGKPVADVGLKDATGKRRALAEFAGKQALVVVFTGIDCPIANGYLEPLSELATRYAG